MSNGTSGTLTSDDGTRIGWTRRGSGPPLVMVSAVMASRRRTPQPDLPVALAEHFTVFTYDRRGTGESTTRTPYAPEQEYQDLHQILELAGDDAVVYGFSSGATLALLAALHGVPIAGLLLLEPPLIPDPDTSARREAERRLSLDRADARRWFDEEVTGVPAEIRAQFPPPTDADLADAPAMLKELTFLPGTTAAQFSPLRTPTLLMVSDHTAPVLRDAARALGRAVPGATLRELPGRWHGVPDDVLVATIREFLAADLTTPSAAGAVMSARHLPLEPVQVGSLPPVVDRAAWQAEVDDLLVREKAHTRQGDALAAARRALPMVAVPRDATVEGPRGTTLIADTFEGRRMLVAYFHMWHDGMPWPQQCEGCTFCASQIQRPEYLHSRDITLAIFCEGAYAESRPYADALGYETPWYSARDSAALVCGRHFGFYACYVRDDDDNVYETYWTTGRGTESALWSYGLMDITVFGRQEHFETSPPGWPRIPLGQHPWRVDGRPTAQWGGSAAAAAAHDGPTPPPYRG